MRSYIVIPEGTPLIRVAASTPHYAANKAQRGAGEFVSQVDPAVVPASTLRGVDPRPVAIPGQLSMTTEEDRPG